MPLTETPPAPVTVDTEESIGIDEFVARFQKAPVREVPNECPSSPLVSVIVPTYNHARFLRHALDSILAQRVEFPFEICVGEDDSTDDTRALCLEYAQKYPQKIRLFLGDRANNIAINGKPSGRFNSTNMILGARGRYVALCEGDDQWSAPNKLAKQVAFLEANADFSACFHNGQVIWDGTEKRLPFLLEHSPGTPPSPQGTCFRTVDRNVFSVPELLSPASFIPTASLMFRAAHLRRVPAWFFKIVSADIAIVSLLSREGKIKFLNFDGCIYRKHEGGITAGDSPLKVYFDRKLLYTYLNQVHGYRYDREFSALVEKHRKITIGWLSSVTSLPPSLASRAQQFVATERTPISSLRSTQSASGSDLLRRSSGASTTPPEVEPSDLPVVLVRSHEFNYSETFVEDHVNYVSKRLTLLYGHPFPRFVKGGRSVLPEATERKIAALLSAPGGTITPELWREYAAGLAAFFKTCGARSALVESGLMGAYVHEACEQAALPYVVHFHGVDAYGKELLSQWHGRYRKFFQSAAKLVVVSQAMRAQLQQLGAPEDKIVLGPYGVSVTLPALARPAEAGPQFLAVGRFVEKKSPHLTLQAFAAVHRHIPAARLVMIGDGPLLPVCQQWAQQNGLAEAVTFTGVQSREQVSRWMASSRVFVQHSVTAANGDSEGLPLAVLEAGAHGLPVVSTLHAGIPDAVVDGAHGYLVPERDVKLMGERMLVLARDAKLAGRMGAAYRERIVAEFSRKRSIERLQQLLAEAANSTSAIAPARPLTEAELEGALPRVTLSEQAMALADAVRRLNSTALLAECLQAAISLDRNDRAAYVQLAQLLVEAGDDESAYLCLKEASRLAALAPPEQATLARLEGSSVLQESPLAQAYREQIGERQVGKCATPRRILVVTNLFPPQELGGYGRTMWEFCDLLTQRGHEVRILTSDSPEWHRAPDPGMERLEPRVERSLRLFGSWVNGGAVMNPDREESLAIARHNIQVVSHAIGRYQPDSVLAGNLDFVGHGFMEVALANRIPVLHRLGNGSAGYAPTPALESPRFCLAGNTQWLNKRLQEQGYKAGNWSVVYPGSPLEHYYRAFAPRFDTLRIAYASIFAPFKGPQVLFDALARLTRMNVPFTLECAGETPDPQFKARCEEFAKSQGFADRIRWHGFMNREGLAAMFSRCNTLVFPSVFEEPFGKTQIEAMAAGLAVVSSGTGGTREIVQHQANGLLFKSSDADDLARQLASLPRDPETWARLAAQGQADAYKFTSLESVRRIEEFFCRFTG